MKLITYVHEGTEAIGAVSYDQKVVPLSAIAADMLALIKLGQEGLSQARKLVESTIESLPLDQITLLAPIPTPIRYVASMPKLRAVPDSAVIRLQNISPIEIRLFRTQVSASRPSGIPNTA